MTPSIVEAIVKSNEIVSEEQPPKPESEGEVESKDEDKADVQDEPSLDEPEVGKPISHGQIVHLWKQLKAHHGGSFSLETLLRGARIYVPPPPPKPEPVRLKPNLSYPHFYDALANVIHPLQSAEYKALMARLRHEEEERKYQRMVSSPSAMDLRPTFGQQFPLAQQFAQVNQSSNKDDMGDDDVTFNDVHRQVVLVINFLVSIFGCAATLWILARWWSTPARLFLTMGGSLLVAIAEVAVYSGYVWHLGEAKRKDEKIKEVKEIVQTWVVGKEDEGESKEVGKVEATEDISSLRKRKIKEKEETL
ncbi:hypothetical protein VP1G_08733 [Cytospora mali]|uniref:Vacuolar ATPase assembly integral membrane protein VPH2 n=1 Tax=Cytospora mali TaxID=578113 RepID=A0A194VCD0_CYTMA|nr:hypothetical protein VP1G_08733 [Valsa mali var. pyri (nom. inval.)]